MIGQAGTGSPEAGIVFRVDPRVLVYTLWTGTRHPVAQQNKLGGPVCRKADYLTASPPWLLVFNFSKPQVYLLLGIGTLPLRSEQQCCVKLFGDFCGTLRLPGKQGMSPAGHEIYQE